MKKLLILPFLLVLSYLSLAQGQLPILNQRLINTFLYNPATTGLNGSSISFLNKSTFSNVQNAPESNLLSAEGSLAQNRIGLGTNIFLDQADFIQNTFANVSLAYHGQTGANSYLSFGLSGDFYMTNVNLDKLSSLVEIEDPSLSNIEQFYYDVSAGLDFSSKYFSLGGSANHTLHYYLESDQPFMVPLYTGYLLFKIPLSAERDELRPILSYKNLTGTGDLLEAGLYYTYDDLFLIGGSYSDAEMYSIAAGLTLSKLHIAFHYENLNNADTRLLGNNREIYLKYSFGSTSSNQYNKKGYKVNFVSAKRKSWQGINGKPRSSTKSSFNKKYISKSQSPKAKAKQKSYGSFSHSSLRKGNSSLKQLHKRKMNSNKRKRKQAPGKKYKPRRR